MSINEDGPGQWIPRESKAAQFATLLARLAVTVPVKVFSFGSSIFTHHRSAERASDKLVCEVLHSFSLFLTEGSLMAKVLKSFLECLTGGALNLHSLEVNPQDTMNVGSPPSLKLYPAADVTNPQWIVGSKNYFLFEHLHHVLKVPCGQQHISSDELML